MSVAEMDRTLEAIVALDVIVTRIESGRRTRLEPQQRLELGRALTDALDVLSASVSRLGAIDGGVAASLLVALLERLRPALRAHYLARWGQPYADRLQTIVRSI